MMGYFKSLIALHTDFSKWIIEINNLSSNNSARLFGYVGL